MYTHTEYLEVLSFVRVGRIKDSRRAQLLKVKVPRSQIVFMVPIATRIRVPDLKRGDKIKLVFDVFVSGKSNRPRFCVRDISLLLEKAK